MLFLNTTSKRTIRVISKYLFVCFEMNVVQIGFVLIMFGQGQAVSVYVRLDYISAWIKQTHDESIVGGLGQVRIGWIWLGQVGLENQVGLYYAWFRSGLSRLGQVVSTLKRALQLAFTLENMIP